MQAGLIPAETSRTPHPFLGRTIDRRDPDRLDVEAQVLPLLSQAPVGRPANLWPLRPELDWRCVAMLLRPPAHAEMKASDVFDARHLPRVELFGDALLERAPPCRAKAVTDDAAVQEDVEHR